MWTRYALVWIVLFVLYGFVQDAGYVTDYLGWQRRVQEGGFLGVIHTYDYPAQLQVYALLMWLIEQLRGVSTWLVHAFNVSLFAAGAVLLSQLVTQVLTDLDHPHSKWAGILAAGLFILSPTNTEIMIWRVCPHYLVSIIVWLGTLLLLRTYLKKASGKHLLGAILLQLLGLFSLELAYALPIAILGWAFFYTFFFRLASWRPALIAFGSAAGLVVLHLLLTKVVQGTWIGHYGAEVATAQPLTEILAAPWRWMARSMVHYRFWPVDLKNGLTELLGDPIVSVALYGVVTVALGRAIFLRLRLREIKQPPPVWTGLLLWIFLAGAGSAAVSQLYFYDLFPIDTDRLGALTVVFAAAFVATLVAMLPKKAMTIVGLVVLMAAGYTQSIALRSWSQSQQLLNGLTSSFSNVLAEAEKTGFKPSTVYLIGYARTFQGVHLLGDNRPAASALAGHLSSSVSGPYQGRQEGLDMIDISQFNQLSLTDKYNAEWGNNRMYFSLNAPGSWLIQKDLGIVSMSNEKYGFDLNVEEYHVELTWKIPPPANTIFLFQEQDQFVRLPYPLVGKSPQPVPLINQ